MSRFVSPLRRRSVLVAGAGTALLAACGTKPPPPPKPTLVKGTLKASAGLNPSVTGRASPLQVRVYELKAPAAFNSADFMSLYQGDQAALGADMLSREEMTLQPNESRPFNGLAPVIPERIITRAPSAELKPDQTDQDTLPPYEVLDAIIEAYMERDLSPREIVAQGFAEADVRRTVGMLKRSEYKRRQAPVGIRVTKRGFGKDWRYPITSGYADEW